MSQTNSVKLLTDYIKQLSFFPDIDTLIERNPKEKWLTFANRTCNIQPNLEFKTDFFILGRNSAAFIPIYF